MAVQEWCVISPSSGSGTTSVSISCLANVGRNSRSTTLTLSAVGVNQNKLLVVNQPGSEVAASINGIPTLSKVAQTIEITGTSNAVKLTFSTSLPEFTLSGFKVSTDNGLTWVNNVSGVNITGDPGSNQTYKWSILLTVTENVTTSNKTCTLTVIPDNLAGIVKHITQVQNVATLTVSPTIVSLSAAGTVVNTTVTSNTTWQIL